MHSRGRFRGPVSFLWVLISAAVCQTVGFNPSVFDILLHYTMQTSVRSVSKRFSRLFLQKRPGLFFLTLFLLVPVYVLHAADATSADVAARRAALEAELQQIEQEINAQQDLLQSKQRERVSLERDVAILSAQIDKAKLDIRARDLTIQKLSGDISDKQSAIGGLNSKLDREKDSLAQLIRKTNEIDDYSLAEMLLGSDTVTSFFQDLDSFQSLKGALQDSFVYIADTKAVTEDAKTALEQKKSEQVSLRTLQVLQKQKIEDQEKEKQRIVTQTKGVEATYQKLISAKQLSAAQIRAELFTLRDSAAIPFGQAVDLAVFAGKQTGVRPALILAVLKQETRLGEYIGTGTWTVDMHPTRDRPLFQVITATLGLDPNRMPVSKQPSYGWGGAMGPAQFIPSTWACYGGYINTKTGDCSNASRSLSWDAFWAGPWIYNADTDRLRKLAGKSSPSSPWDNQDAFMASALLLKDNGADRGTFDAERLAALRYFAGWGNASKPAYAFYGDSVMEFAGEFQQQMDILSRS